MGVLILCNNCWRHSTECSFGAGLTTFFLNEEENKIDGSRGEDAKSFYRELSEAKVSVIGVLCEMTAVMTLPD